jgi:uncharacterized small protein (DUF1192 family)
MKMAKRAQPLRKSVVEQVNQDELALFQDSELDTRASFLYDEMRRKNVPIQNTKTSLYDSDLAARSAPYEVELAYVQREQQIRMKRRVAHRAYLNAQDDGYVDESFLPEFKATPPPWYWQN